MKKILCAVLVFMTIVYGLPYVTARDAKAQPPINDAPAQAEKPQDAAEFFGYDEKTRISVLTENEVRDMSLHEYLVCTLAAEMPASFPEEALKAQAVAARSYALYKIENDTASAEHKGAQLCTDYTHCTAFYDVYEKKIELWGANADYYFGKIENAVSATDGIAAESGGKVIAAVFHSASSDFTEAAVNVWGSDYPYLVSVESSGGVEAPDYYATTVISQRDFAANMKKLYPRADFSSPVSEWFKDSHRSQCGGVIDLLCGGVRVKGADVRAAAELNSTNFKVTADGADLVFSTVGTGHGVGMSQYGAREMALSGKYFDEIICHYYSGVNLILKK